MNKRVAAVGLLVLVLIFGGVYLYYTRAHTGSLSNVGGGSASIVPSNNPGSPAAPTVATIYTVSASGGDANGLMPEKVDVGHAGAPARDVIEALIQASNSPLPKGTKLRDIHIDQGLATVDFSQEFQQNFHGGDLQEAQAINAILLTLGQFSTIDRVQITVEGAAIDSLGGHLEISAPLDVERADTTQQANSDVGTQSH